MESLKKEYGPGYLARAVFVKLFAGKNVARHIDVGGSYTLSHRIHISLIAEEDNIMYIVRDEDKTFKLGEIWEINDMVVNNCHKLPQHLFQRRILTIEEIESAWDTVLRLIPEGWKIIFTVSPVKYTKLGLEENFISKSILRLSIKSFIENYSNSYYFPSFEIITDELRDYSFYKENGTHPNEAAVEVVFNRFRSFLNF